MAARATPAASRAAVSRPTIWETAIATGIDAAAFERGRDGCDMAVQTALCDQRAGNKRRPQKRRAEDAHNCAPPGTPSTSDDAEQEARASNAARRAARGRVAVERSLKRAIRSADPCHRVTNRAQRAAADNRRKSSISMADEGERDEHERLWRHARAHRPWWRSRRGAATISRRAGTFRRPLDRDQSLSLSECRELSAELFARLPDATEAAALAASGDARLWRAVAAACRAGAGDRRSCCPCRRAGADQVARSFWRRAMLNIRALPRSPGHDVTAVPAIRVDERCRLLSSWPIRTIRTVASSRARTCWHWPSGFARRGGVLVVDEAFMDVGPPGGKPRRATSGSATSWCCARSENFSASPACGLASPLRLRRSPARLAAALGPWSVSGPALAVGSRALNDTAWIERTRERLARASQADGCIAGKIAPRRRRRHESVPIGPLTAGRRSGSIISDGPASWSAVSARNRSCCARAFRVRNLTGGVLKPRWQLLAIRDPTPRADPAALSRLYRNEAHAGGIGLARWRAGTLPIARKCQSLVRASSPRWGEPGWTQPATLRRAGR